LRAVTGELGRDVERTRQAGVVPDGTGRQAKAERGHEAIEEAVVVIRSEDDHDAGIKFRGKGAGFGKSSLDILLNLRLLLSDV